jgi:hypothetical protein
MREFEARRRGDFDRAREPARDLEPVVELDAGKRAATDSITVDPGDGARGQLAIARRELDGLARANDRHDAFASSVARMRIERAFAEAERLGVIAEDDELAVQLIHARRAAMPELAASFRPSRSALDEKSRFADARPRWEAETSAWTAVRRAIQIDRPCPPPSTKRCHEPPQPRPALR